MEISNGETPMLISYDWVEPNKSRLFEILEHSEFGIQNFSKQKKEELLSNSAFVDRLLVQKYHLTEKKQSF